MPVRVTFHDREDADQLVETLVTGGFDAGVTRERFAGEDDGEAFVFVVHTDAPAVEVEELVADSDAFVEESSPLIDASEPDLSADLPAEPRRRLP